MSRVLVRCFGVSLDGFGAGPDQDLEHPLGVGAEAVFQWFFHTRTFKAMHGEGSGGDAGIDDDFARRGFDNIGAWIIGRNMFGPVRGDWGDESWRGWWGDTPPYHVPVFVLTHHPRKDLAMDGGTIFHFVTGGIGEALARAREAAGPKDVRVGGGVSTIREYLATQSIDELHLAVAPALMGRGENLFAGLDLPALGYRSTRHVASDLAMHVIVSKVA
ncbi:MAG: dihydrofolate reductase family protein [Alphaproteobacteria bacterium]|nr:dihydrofolate reductase family protein [Alphaproteobacteria bacterium]MBV9692061.1 dihydrofolate reductase family protein [Alphaproteobacteria bacterium]